MAENYSVWLMPEKESEEMENLKETISELSKRYDTPVFPPHITLVGGIEEDISPVKKAVKKVSEGFNPVEIEFQSTHFSTTRHQCNYLLVKPSAGLLKMREEVRNRVGEPESMYVPHLSLIYSDMNISERQELDESLTGLPDRFDSGKLVIFDTSKKEEKWSAVEEYSLQG